MEAAAITFGASMISTILKPMAERAGNEILDHCDKMVNIKREIHNLQNTLHLILAVIQDAEEKQIENNHIRAWLRELVDIGYEARDVLDDFFTYSASIRAKKASTSVNLRSSLFFFPIIHRSQLATDIKRVRKRLDEMMKQKEIVSILNVVRGPSGSESIPVRKRPEIGPSVNKHRDLFVGREGEKERIMQIVLNHTDNRVDIIPIWGMGGIGKTTLAQSIYNDVRVTDMKRLWHCVGEEKLNAKEIIMSSVDGLNDESRVEVIQRKLVEKFKNDRFLIVFDDVWVVDRNEWKMLLAPLSEVGKGGVVILTTRSGDIINTTNTPIPESLQPLSDEDCWLIFENCAFPHGNSNSKQELKSIGMQIVEKLKGLPLAAEVVGCSLLNEPNVETWKSFLETKEWLLKTGDEDVMPELKWSYNRLLPHLKQCFAYCSLFPKDHKFDKKLLIEMWMAHDLVLNVGRGGEVRRPEDVGAQYFKELVNASFFQCVDNEYVMHDMIHDLVLLVSSEEFITVSKYSLPHQMDKVRHVKIILDEEDHQKNLRLLHTLNKRILTLVVSVYLDLGQAFKQMKNIRLLVVSSIKITKIPDCIKELKHLRYLDVRGTKVKTLPDSLCELYNLQTLAADEDVVLPKDVGNLVNLRHLKATLHTHKGIAKLTSLQELSTIIVREGGTISELGDLGELRGELKIKCLGNVTSSEDAAQAKMREKTHIDGLKLQCYGKPEMTSNTEDVLQAFNCPPKLKSLGIDGYNGHKFPSWLTNAANDSMRYLSSLTIKYCLGVELLEFDAFVSLKQLTVRCCDNLECIRLGKDDATTIEDLTIRNCRELMEIKIESLPSLKRLKLAYCRKLRSFPPCLVKIEKMSVYCTDKLSSLMFTIKGIKSLKYLNVDECSMLKHFFIVEEGSTSSSSSSSSSTTVLSLPDDINITLRTHKFEDDAQGRLVLKRREDVE